MGDQGVGAARRVFIARSISQWARTDLTNPSWSTRILDAYRYLASVEGVFCEPASAASVAGLLEHGADDAQKLVCVLTGHGLKDPDTAGAEGAEIVRCPLQTAYSRLHAGRDIMQAALTAEAELER